MAHSVNSTEHLLPRDPVAGVNLWGQKRPLDKARPDLKLKGGIPQSDLPAIGVSGLKD